MTLREHNARCRCEPSEPCDVLAAILREQHGGGFIEVAEHGRHPRAWIRG